MAKYLELIRALLPEAETIGIVYTTSEPNSIAHLAQVEELAPDYGFTVESVGITASNELGSACDTLIARGVGLPHELYRQHRGAGPAPAAAEV